MADEQKILAPEDIFKQSQEEASSQASKNLLYGVISSLVTDNPSAYFNAVQQNDKIASQQKLGQKFFETDDYKNLTPEYKNIVAGFAGKGDIENAYQFIGAGRMAQQRAKEVEDRKRLESAAALFSKTGDPTPYVKELRVQHPTAAATFEQTFGKGKRSEIRQGLQDVSQFAQSGLNELAKKDIPGVAKNQELFKKVLNQNPTKEDLALDTDELAARFGVSKAEALKLKNGLKQAQDSLGVRATDPGFFRMLGEKVGLLNQPAQVSPQAAVQSLEGVMIDPAQAEAQRKIDAERERLKKIKSGAEAAQASEGFLTQGMQVPAGVSVPESAPKDQMVSVQLPDGKKGSVPASKLGAFMKQFPGAKALGQ